MTKKKELLFGGDTDWSHADLGSSIHTALRKACDSKITSVAYNLVGGLTEEWTYVLKRWERIIKGLPDPDWQNYTRKEEFPDGIWKPEVDLATRHGVAVALQRWCDEWSEFAPDAKERDELDRKQHDGFTSMLYALTGVLALCDEGEWEHGLLAYVFYLEQSDG